LEDLYLPFKKKRNTKSEIANKKRLRNLSKNHHGGKIMTLIDVIASDI